MCSDDAIPFVCLLPWLFLPQVLRVLRCFWTEPRTQGKQETLLKGYHLWFFISGFKTCQMDHAANQAMVGWLGAAPECFFP